jgi:hypothetical protein
MEDAQGSMVPVSSVPRELQKPPSLADLWPQMTGLITALVTVCAFGDKVLTVFLFVQKEAPVRVYLTNACIAFFEACSAMTVNQNVFVFILLAFLCLRVNIWETRQCRSKENQVAELNFDWLHQLLATEDADSQDDAGPVGAALQDNAGPVAILPRKQTRKKTNETFFFEHPIEDL